MSPDLREVRGTMWLPEAWVPSLTDPLPLLPEPGDDLRTLRTYPGAPSQGEIEWQHLGEGRVTFRSRLPKRFGALGATRHGLFANGGWYPQPIVADRVPLVAWDVRIALPPGTAGAAGGTVGHEVLHWTGDGERASLAVVRGGVITPLVTGEHDLVLLTRRPPRKPLVRQLEAQLALLEVQLRGAAVQAPLRRRLVRHGPGLAYVSDRAFRLSPGVRFAHRRAVVRGAVAAWLPVVSEAGPHPFEREVAAAGQAQWHEAALRGGGADQLLGTFRWVPQVNALLSSQNTAFFSEILDRVHPADPVRDDLMEVLDPHAPGTAVVAQLDDRYGAGTGRCVADAVATGTRTERAAAHCGADAAWVTQWRAPYPDQDYVLDVEGSTVTIDRQAPEGAPLEAFVVRIDGEDTPLVLPPGPHTLQLPTPPKRVVVDPRRVTAQRSRVRDAWPATYDLTFSAVMSSLNLSQGQLFGALYGTIRRRYDTHNLLLGSLSNSRTNRLSANLSFLRKEGPLLDGWRRPHRIRARVGASWLNPQFADTDGLAIAVDGSLQWAHDTRVSSDFPLSGHRLSATVGGGAVPATGEQWANAGLRAVGVGSWHPRHALAARASATVALADVPHRRLALGGASLMRSIPTLPACLGDDDGPCTVLASERLLGAVEWRSAVLRDLSVPTVLGWGSELQLAVGLEAVAARVEGAPVWATGVTVGALALGDMLGAQAAGIGLTAAWPVAWHPSLTEVQPTAVPEIYLRFSQAF
ncbi:MAG: hypothetical protein KTR31_12660 [Myxococcales bacterium]|nr:hypothetical protein [Myxococcales bacterium]